MPNVSETMHMGIMRSAGAKQSASKENIKKARRTLYSLISSGLHGENGLDPETAIHLMQASVWQRSCLTESEIHGHARKNQQEVPEVNTVAASHYC